MDYSFSNSISDKLLSKIFYLQKQKNSSKFWNISFEQGLFLANLVSFVKPLRVLEIGTSNGFSTLFLGLNLSENSKISTVEIDKTRFELSKQNFLDCDFSSFVDSNNCDCLKFLDGCSDGEKFELVFVDAGHQFYEEIFDLIISKKLFSSGSVLVFDNVTSHKSLEKFVSKVSIDFDCELIKIGGGMLVVNF